MEFSCCSILNHDARDPLHCIYCGSKFHIACVLPSKETNWTPDESVKLTWCCPSCIAKQKYNKDDTPIRNVTKRNKQKNPDKCTTSSSLSADESGLLANTDLSHQRLLEEFRNVVKSEIREAFSSFNKVVEDLRSEVSTLQSSVSFLSQNYDSMCKKMQCFETKMKSYDTLKADHINLQLSVSSIQADANKKEQWVRRSNIEIIGIPESKSENLMDIVLKLSNIMDSQICSKSDIDFVTRVTPKQNDSKKPRPVVIRFLSRHKKDDLLARLREKALKASDLGFIGNNNRIYFNDHLTSFNKSLLRKTKELAREKKYMYTWVKNCAIMIRKTDTSPVLHITSETDLKKL